MKKKIKSLINQLGYTVYKTESIPVGVDLILDINKLYPNGKIKSIFDVGANIGQTALYFSQNFPAAHIRSFEPIQTTFKDLQRNTAHLTRVNCFNHAFGSSEGTHKVYLQPKSELNSLVNKINTPSSGSEISEIVTVKTIDSFVDENNIETIDLIKTDTEGFDIQVIKGAEKSLSQCKTKFIFSEVSFREKDNRHTFFPVLTDYLRTKGFRFHALYDLHHGPLLGIYFCNALFVNSEAINDNYSTI